MKVSTQTPLNQNEYTGTPDYIRPRKQHLVKSTYIEYNYIAGYIEEPVYKELNEISPDDLKGYDDKRMVYLYIPEHHYITDSMGIKTFEIVGATRKKSDKIVRLLAKDITKSNTQPTNDIIYLVIEGSKCTDCGRMYDDTKQRYDMANYGEEYTASYRAKWIKENVDDFKYLFGKIYHD